MIKGLPNGSLRNLIATLRATTDKLIKSNRFLIFTCFNLSISKVNRVIPDIKMPIEKNVPKITMKNQF